MKIGLGAAIASSPFAGPHSIIFIAGCAPQAHHDLLITHTVSGVFDLNMDYVLQLIDDVKRMFMQLEHVWASG